MKKGIIFDFNGTLFFDSAKHEEAWCSMALKLRGTPMSHEELTTKMHGRNNKKVLELIFGKEIDEAYSQVLSKEKEATYRQMCLNDLEHFHLVDGATQLFDTLKAHKIPMSIASASIKENIDFFVEHFHLDQWFDPSLIVYDDGSYENKIEMFKQSAKQMNLSTKDCIIIEDSVSGVEFANAVDAYQVIAIGDDKEKFNGMRVDQFIHDFVDFKIDDFIEPIA